MKICLTKTKRILIGVLSILLLIACFCAVKTFKTTYADNVFQTENAASIRVVEPTGIRFKIKVDESNVDAENIIGMFIVPKDYVNDATKYEEEHSVGEYAYFKQKTNIVFYDQISETKVDYLYKADEGDTFYYGNGVNDYILLENYNLDFIGIGYIKTGDNYTYSTFDLDKSAFSIAYIANRACYNENESEQNRAVCLDYAVKSAYAKAGMTQTESNYALGELNGVEFDAIKAQYPITISASDISVDVTSAEALKVEPEIKINNVNVKNADSFIKFTSSNEAVFTVDSLGNITKVGRGIAALTIETLGITKTITVNIKEVVEIPKIEIDLSTYEGDNVLIPTSNFDGAVTSIKVENNSVPFTISGEYISIAKSILQTALGEHNIEIVTDKNIYYNGKVMIISMVISDAAELTAFMTGNNQGYYVLDNEIDYNNNLFTYNATSGETTKPNDFYGTLDGRGHTIKNIKVSSGTRSGMFNELAEGATIKNIAFTNLVEQNVSADYHTRNTFIWVCHGNVENVYMECTRLQIVGGAFGGVIGQVESTGKVNKFVANITEGTKTSGTHGGAIGGTSTKNVSNIVSISKHYPAVYKQDGWYGESHLTNIYTFTSLSEALKANQSFSSEVWNEDIWDIGGGIPVLNTCESMPKYFGETIIDLSEATDRTVSLSLDGIDGTVSGVKFGNTSVSFVQEGNALKINKTALESLAGKKDVTIETSESDYLGIVEVCTMIISNKVELKAFETYTSTGSNHSRIDGYFILDDDIDYNGDKLLICGNNEDFYGTLDGKGHTIKNVKVNISTGLGDRGLFSNILYGTIKNIAFVGVDNTESRESARIMLAMCLEGRIENVYMQGTRGQVKSTGKGGGVVTEVRSTATINNLVVNFTETGTKATDAHGAAMTGINGSSATVTNVIAISSLYPAVDYPSGWSNPNQEKFSTICGYASIDDAASAGVTYSDEIWDTTLWDISGAIPVFKTAIVAE